MELQAIEKVRDGKYLKSYELSYLNKAGKIKKYEIVSRRELHDAQELGAAPSGVSMVATCGEKLLLLREFRMGVNRYVYNLCAGMLEAGETVEECTKRELYEETGLKLEGIQRILPPSYAAVAISDVTTYLVFARVSGELSDHTSLNEEIQAGLYSREEVRQLLESESFSSRAQIAAYFFVQGAIGEKTAEAGEE